jgi:hypothetical protein
MLWGPSGSWFVVVRSVTETGEGVRQAVVALLRAKE